MSGAVASEASPTEAAGEWLNVVGRVPLPDEVLRDRILFFFDKRIVVPTGAGGAPEAAFTIDPPLAGVFTTGPNYVCFTLTRRPEQNIYRVKMHPGLRSEAGHRLNPHHQDDAFAPFVFEPQRLWVLSESAERTVLGMMFPARVNLETLRKHVSVLAAGGATAAFDVERGTEDKVCRLVLTGAIQWPVRITVGAGLTDETGALRLVEDRTFTYPADAALQVIGVEWGNVGKHKQEIVIRFSHGVTTEHLKQHLTFTREPGSGVVPFELASPEDLRCHTAVLQMDLETPESFKLTVTVSADLPSVSKAVLAKAHSVTLERRVEPLGISELSWDQEGYWEEDDEGEEVYVEGEPRLHLELTKSVDLQELRSHLQVTPQVPNLEVEHRWGNTYAISGEWKSNQDYTITVTPGLKDQEGLELKKALKAHTRSGDMPNYLRFGLEGKYYLPRRSGVALPLRTRGLDKVTLSLHRLFPSNVMVALDDINEGKGGREFAEAWSEPITTQELAVRAKLDGIASTPIQLDGLLPVDKKGVFCLEARGQDRADTKIVLATDIGVLAHWQDQQLVVFAHNLFSLAPFPLAKVSVYSSKNQLLGEANTDEQGIGCLGPFNKAFGIPRVVVIEQGQDYTFLELTPREELIPEISPEMPAYDRAGYDAYIYADRDLYRPGETAHLRWTVRTNYGDALKDVPLLVSVLKPNGRTLLSEPTTLSSIGTGGLDLATQKAYPTGTYTAQLAVPGSNKVIGSYQFKLEDFVPNRIKTEVVAPEQTWLAGTEYEVKVNAQHLFGAPAAQRKCTVDVLVKRGDFAPKAWRGYRFDNDAAFTTETVSCGESDTDEEGNATFTFTYEPATTPTFPLKAVVFGRVFELGGRAVGAKTERALLPSDICLGVMASSVSGGIEVHTAAIGPDEKPATLDKVKVTLEKQVWNYYVRRYYTHHQPRWSESFESIETREVPLTGGKGSTTFPMSGYGRFRVRVHADQTPQYSTLTFYAYGGECQIMDTARPSLIKIALGKPVYEIGEEAEVRIESPFDGQGIVVLQGEEIQDIIPVTIQDNTGTVRFVVTKQHFPNTWVEATVIHAIQKEHAQVYPFSSFAVANVCVRNAERRLAVSFPSLPEEIRPAGEVQFDIDVRDGAGNPAQAELTLAAVDEGIHSITDYKNPDPYAWLSRSRRPDVRRAHYYDKVAYDFDEVLPGGDAEFEMGKRAAAIGDNWIRPVALWSGPVQTDPNGRAVVKMQVPEFTGQLRVVAVACSDTALGAHSGHVYVRRPYMLQTSLPRFLLPGDTFTSRAVVYNHSAAPCKAKVVYSVSGAMGQGEGSQTLDVPAHGEATLTADFAAGAAIGQGEIRWEVLITTPEGQQVERLVEVAPMPVRTPAAYQSAYELVVMKPGETRTVRNAVFVEDERTDMKLTVGAQPLLRLEKALQHVVGYPYGCVEQTTSRLMPLYLLRQHAALVESVMPKTAELDGYLESGINRLFSMQTSSGGMGFWPGAETPNPYGSVYALHFLTLVKQGREFELPEDSFKALQDYVRNLASDWESDSTSHLYLRAYALYVLALDGDLKAVQQIGRFDTITVPRPARFLLAAALALNTKNYDRAALYLSSAPSEPYAVTRPDEALSSDIRNTAIELMALLQMKADPKKLAERADELVKFLRTHHYGTTQETAFIVTALGQYFGQLAANIDQAAAKMTWAGQEKTIQGRETWRGHHEGPGASFTVANTGQTDLFVSVTTRGVPEKPDLTPIRKGLGIRREFYTARGAKHDGPTFAQAEAYVIGLVIEVEAEAEHLVVADLLPAGFEIENPRLAEDAIPGDAFKGAVTPSFLEIRDDRLVLAFDALEPGVHRFYYVVRAVTPGKYDYPRVEAECMYDASIRGASGASGITVAPARTGGNVR